MMSSNRIFVKWGFINPLTRPQREVGKQQEEMEWSLIVKILTACKQMHLNTLHCAHTCSCQISRAGRQRSEHREPIPGWSEWSVRCEQWCWRCEGREEREMPANTPDHSIAPRPWDNTSHSPAFAHARASPPSYRPCFSSLLSDYRVIRNCYKSLYLNAL